MEERSIKTDGARKRFLCRIAEGKAGTSRAWRVGTSRPSFRTPPT